MSMCQSFGPAMCSLLFIGAILTESARADETSRGSDEAFQYASPELARLESLIGPWSVTETHYDPKGNPVGSVKGTEEIGWILDRHAIRRVYSTRTEASAYRAIGTLTWNAATNTYRGVWFDNVSTTTPTAVTGTWREDTNSFVFTLDALKKDGSMIQYKVIETREDENHREATTFVIDKEQVTKRMTVHYKRSVPCPAGPRPVGLGPVWEGKLAPGEPKKSKGKDK